MTQVLKINEVVRQKPSSDAKCKIRHVIFVSIHIPNEEEEEEEECTRAVCEVRRLAAVRRCYTEGGGDCYAKL